MRRASASESPRPTTARPPAQLPPQSFSTSSQPTTNARRSTHPHQEEVMTPSGIIMQSSSVGATQEAIAKVMRDNGHEPELPAAAEVVAPKLEDFENEEAFEKAQEEFEATHQSAEDKAEEER